MLGKQKIIFAPMGKWFRRSGEGLPTGGVIATLLLVYGTLAFVFSEERMLNTDCSYQLFSSVNDKGFFFQEGRVGVWPTQLLLVLGIHLGLPMKMLVVAYSMSFPLLYGAIALVNLRVFRCPEAALTTMAALIIGSASTFFHATTETHQLLAASSLLYGAWHAYGNRRTPTWTGILPFIIIGWCMTIHPNALFTVFFVTGLALLYKLLPWRSGFLAVFLALAYTGISMLAKDEGSYDSAQYAHLAGSLGQLADLDGLASMWFLKEWLSGQYHGVLLLGSLVVVFNGRPLVSLFSAVSILGFVVVTLLTFHAGDSLAMMEKSFMPALFMAILPFCVMVQRARFRSALLVVLLACTCHSMFFLMRASRSYSDRLSIIADLLHTHGPSPAKIIIAKSAWEGSPLDADNWALSLDALIMSRCMGPTAMTIFMTDEADRVLAEMPADAEFLYTSWNPYGMILKNRKYFNLPLEPYVRVVPPQAVGEPVSLASPPTLAMRARGNQHEALNAVVGATPAWGPSSPAPAQCGSGR